MLIERLEKTFGYDKPIFTEDIFKCMESYSRQRVYQLIAEAIDKNMLERFDTGVYYLPTVSEFGRSTLTVNEVVDRKYIRDSGKVFGIYGKHVIDLNFLISTQVPNVIEVITNKESRDVREIEIRGRKVILRKSRTPITNDNFGTYTLLELFCGIDPRSYREDEAVRSSVCKYVKDNGISLEKLFSLSEKFPARAMKNLVTSGAIYDITQK